MSLTQEITDYFTIFWNLIPGWLSAFITTLIGAWLGGRYTLKGVKEEAALSENRSNREALELQISVLKGIKCEISILLSLYNKRMRNALDKLNPDEPFLYVFPVGDDNFTFYEGSAKEVAKLNDASTELIISMYVYARSLLETFKANNNFLEEYQQACVDIKKNNDDAFYVELFKEKHMLLVEYGQMIKSIDAEVMEVIQKGIAAIDREVEEKTAKLLNT